MSMNKLNDFEAYFHIIKISTREKGVLFGGRIVVKRRDIIKNENTIYG